MKKSFIKCPHCGYYEEVEVRPCDKKDCINYKEMKIACTQCEHNKNSLSSIDFYQTP